MRHLFILGFVALVPAAGLAWDSPAEWKLAEADGQKWVARVKAVSRDGWTVERQGNEISVRRSKPVAIVRIFPNSPPNAEPSPDGERTIKFVLRFAPRMSIDEYDRLAAVNAASDKEYDRLHRAVGLPHKFEDFIATNPEEKTRVAEFRAAVARLPRHNLPDLYTPDHSIYFLHPWDGWSFPAEKAVAAECRDIEDTLMRCFGIFNPAAATRGQGVGRYLPEQRP